MSAMPLSCSDNHDSDESRCLHLRVRRPKDTPVFLNFTGPSLSTPSIPVNEEVRSVTPRAHRSPDARLNWDDADPAALKPERRLKKDRDGKTIFNASNRPSLSFSARDKGCWGKKIGAQGRDKLAGVEVSIPSRSGRP